MRLRFYYLFIYYYCYGQTKRTRMYEIPITFHVTG